LKQAQELGFSLSEIKELLKLKADKKSRCNDVQAKAEKHLKDVEEKLERLSRIKLVLSDLVGQCRDKRTADECPILACFDDCKYSPLTEGEDFERKQNRK
jgi:MerR family mercuric resistance operon transcriptional regulator